MQTKTIYNSLEILHWALFIFVCFIGLDTAIRWICCVCRSGQRNMTAPSHDKTSQQLSFIIFRSLHT